MRRVGRRIRDRYRRLRDADPGRPPSPPAWWVFAAAGVGLVLVAGLGAVTLRAGTAPSPPFVPVGDVTAVDPAVLDRDRGILFVSVDERDVRAYVSPPGVELTYCPDSGHIESASGRVWDVRGRALDGRGSLTARPVRVHGRELYLNPEAAAPVADPVDRTVAPACAGGG